MTFFKKYTAGVLFILLIFSTGCATIFKGSTADLQVNSQPSNAQIFIDGQERGQTPQTLTLDRDGSYNLLFKKDGYEDVSLQVDKKFDAGTALLGNIVSWSVLGIVVDVATGAAYSLEPGEIKANMDALQSSNLVPQEGEGITVIMLTKEEWEQVRSAE